MVGNEEITDLNRSAWQSNIGYVAQQIYLADTSVARNIAFGIAPEHIDYERVEQVARMAQLDEFITNNFPEGYHTQIGERGFACQVDNVSA